MRWTVVWLQVPQADLADLWLQADPSTRKKITQTVDGVERELSKRPEDVGKLLDSGLREIIALPVGIIFRVHPDDRLVKVVAFHVVPSKEGS